MDKQKKMYLLPNRFQLVGWIIAAAAAAVVVAALRLTKTPYLESLPAVLGTMCFEAGLFLVGFSREKQEDEFTLYLRVRSAMNALLIVFALWLVKMVATPFLVRLVGADSFARIAVILNWMTGYVGVFVLYLALFKIRLARYNKESAYEE